VASLFDCFEDGRIEKLLILIQIVSAWIAAYHEGSVLRGRQFNALVPGVGYRAHKLFWREFFRNKAPPS
jgi:hypothetical protein